MSRFRKIEFLDASSPFFLKETSFCKSKKSNLPLSSQSFADEELGFALDFLSSNPLDFPFEPFLPSVPSPFDIFETVTDLIQIQKTPFSSSFRRIQERKDPWGCSSLWKTEFEKTELEKTVFLQNLSDRVSALELGFEQIFKPKISNIGFEQIFKPKVSNIGYKYQDREGGVDRKYKWTAEIKGGADRKYKWTADIKGGAKDSPVSRTYTFKSIAKPVGNSSPKKEKASKSSSPTRVVEIEGPEQHASALIQKAFERKRAAAAKANKGKRKELSPQNAALIIQMSFRAYLVRRSQTLRGLRDLAVAKAKLKEIKTLFNNFSYRRCIAADPEERQRFSEKIIVLLLTVDAIEGSDHMIREARRGMVVELEAMLEVVDPQPPGKLGSMKRRKFDLPECGSVQKEMAIGVAEVVQMLNEDENVGHAFAEVQLGLDE